MGACASGTAQVEVSSSVQLPSPHDKKYTVGGKLGEGMSGTVFSGVDKRNNMAVAIKVMPKKDMRADDVEAAHNEVRLLQKIRHPNILSYIDHFETPGMAGEGGYIYLVTDKICGGELFDDIISKEHYTEDDARKAVRFMLETIGFLHDKGVVHRDLKPENIMLTQPGAKTYKIVDFGLAMDVPDEYGGVTSAAGTPGYLPPEALCRSAELNYGKPADVWAIGVITYILLCGYPPFYSDTGDAELYEAIRRADIDFDPEDWGRVSAAAKQFIRAILVVDVKKRPNIKQCLAHPWMQVGAQKQQKLTAEDKKNLDDVKEKIRKMQLKKKLRNSMMAVLFQQRMALASASAKAGTK